MIKLYDLIISWNSNATSYFNGTTPMKINEDYIVFLKRNPNLSVKDTYIFSTMKYGHTITSKESRYLHNYEQYTLTLKEISNYDFVFLLVHLIRI
ncbi:MAG TPA: hypothetical protein GX747_04630 [Tenericutes bacterium]|nr:hypothetical protein [Mycoplasmatota bacterium]